MEELIGIIVAVAVLIFKAVSKKMNDSADKPVRPATRPACPDQAQLEPFPGVNYGYVGEAPELKVVRVEIPKEAPKEIDSAQIKSKQKPVEILKEVEPAAEKKEKIDPKKLIVYSEIMNRKY